MINANSLRKQCISRIFSNAGHNCCATFKSEKMEKKSTKNGENPTIIISNLFTVIPFKHCVFQQIAHVILNIFMLPRYECRIKFRSIGNSRISSTSTLCRTLHMCSCLCACVLIVLTALWTQSRALTTKLSGYHTGFHAQLNACQSHTPYESCTHANTHTHTSHWHRQRIFCFFSWSYVPTKIIFFL